ncbi:MAG: UPF0280 family protein [Candidatus Bathyarchaeota archaeon]
MSARHRSTYAFGDTRGVLSSDHPEFIEVGLDSLNRNRRALIKYIERDPWFRHSLEPVPCRGGPEVAARMAEAAEACGVGPMAAVAGVLADLAREAMVDAGASHAVVENGGEASVHGSGAVYVGFRAGDRWPSGRLGFQITKAPIGVATSSAWYSHAFSFGEADSVTVFADSAGLADAAATAVCNMVSGGGGEVVRSAIRQGLGISGVQGVLVLYEGLHGVGGVVPEFVMVEGPGESEGVLR